MTISDTTREPLSDDHDKAPTSRELPLSWPRVQLAGATTDLFETDDAIEMIMRHAEDRNGEVLGVVSINLDHLHHFGVRASVRAARA